MVSYHVMYYVTLENSTLVLNKTHEKRLYVINYSTVEKLSYFFKLFIYSFCTCKKREKKVYRLKCNQLNLCITFVW